MPPPAPSRFLSAFRTPVPARADILMSIRPEHMESIASGKKNHEYRRYLIPASVRRIWFYTSAPESAICYVAQVGPGREPGEVPEDGGIGNEDFNAGKKVSKFGYEIQRLWKLNGSVSRVEATRRGYFKAPPQKYNWAPGRLISDFPLQGQVCVLGRVRKRARKGDAAEERTEKGDAADERAGQHSPTEHPSKKARPSPPEV